ncbi:MAG TPA: glycerate kinase [Gaiellaceae bacterium]
MRFASALACPASLKGVLSAAAAADALGEGFAQAGVECRRLPVADGGDGTVTALCGGDVGHYDVHDAFGRPRSALVGRHGDAFVVEAAQVLPLDQDRLDPLAASSRGLGELLALIGASRLLVGLGGTATMDAGAGLLDELAALSCPTTVLCDVQTTLYDAPRLFGPQKGAMPAQVAELEARFRAFARLAPYAELPGSGAAGGLGAALASLGAKLAPGAATVLDLVGFDPRSADLVVTGEGRVDATTTEGKAPAEVVRRCRDAGVPCVVFGGVVEQPLADAETVSLSGDPARARDDLVELGLRLGTRLLDAAR